LGKLQLVRIKNGEETILEETPVPDSFDGTCFYSPEYILELEKHYQKTGKPKRGKVDIIYVTREQKERRH